MSNLSWLNVGNFGIGTSTPAQKLDVAGNVKLSGELLGSKHVYTFTMNGMMAVPYAEQGYLMASGVFMSATRGVVMPRAGSITAYSICFDAVADGPTPIIEIRRNSTPVWSFVPDDIVGTGKSAYAVQARGTDTFAAGDKLIIGTATNEDATDVCIANVIMTVEVYFND